MNVCPVFAFAIDELSVLALVGLAGGLYLFIFGFRLVARKHLVADTPTSKIGSASLGLVEVSGQVTGPYAIPAAITGDSCFLYRTVAWQQGDARRRNEWDKVAEEKQHVPFFLSDGSGRMLVDAQGAELDLERDFREVFDAPVFSFGDGLPAPVSSFLARNGVTPRRRIRVEEWTIKPNDALFIVGTVAESASAAARSTTSGAPSVDAFAPLPEIIRLSSSGTATTAAEMTLQGKIAAALTKAGIQKPEAWAAAGISTEAMAVQPLSQVSQILVNNHNGQAARGNGANVPSPVVLRKGENNPTFLISWRSRQDVIRSLSWKSLSMVFGGGGLILIGIYVLLQQAGML